MFPGAKDGPLSDMTLTKILRVACPGDWTVHGFRSSFRDWAANETSIPGEVVEAALAHTVANKVEAAYRRTDFLEKRKGLMLSWSNYIAPASSIHRQANEKPASKVTAKKQAPKKIEKSG